MGFANVLKYYCTLANSTKMLRATTGDKSSCCCSPASEQPTKARDFIIITGSVQLSSYNSIVHHILPWNSTCVQHLRKVLSDVHHSGHSNRLCYLLPQFLLYLARQGIAFYTNTDATETIIDKNQ